MNKLIGYLVSILGLLSIAFTVKPLKDTALASIILSYAGTLGNIVFVAVGAVLVVAGLLILRKSSGGRQAKEVPIYHGKNIVGYRRLKK